MTAIAALDVAALKAECRRRRIDISCLLEKSELQAALLSARYYEDPEQDVACAVCGEFDDEEGNDLLLCDGAGCRAAHHLRCLSPPLLSVPAGCWLCPRCTEKSDRPVDRMPLGEVKAELLRRGVRTAGLLEKHEESDLDLLTPRLVRAAVEERLGLPAGSLKAEREQIAQHIDRALRELRGERG
ncbi:hypothetical protein EMIHUDRAFT_211119 [Emiliania huxleyi CCMP1516]|uniref:PHD-type domain-containing protein n=2 Tax=Emiliania huxleyi TaxID=2903 RepID=A0A0D3IXR6_EMIH1|nr:hypothetical protein EMIHUDRAFT_211119 [Emiliania huxleyi CCMP1516]EOD16051.1 hypothetical protein EMIHUDRAFT_211119 [Emiliania huxleyi CCMP1516]|eukprot:XP_005768480.1 hypothetical protein EMIHUDRAFT_211119 [Emiliania huxleyi CCMP1516]